MNCPGCQTPMKQLTLAAVQGTSVTIDFCRSCRAFWFDPYEDIHLTVASTVQLFQLIGGDRSAAAPPSTFPKSSQCPICNAPLKLTHDRQRNTPFIYWRCETGHGRFTPFVEFLREKDFIRAPSPEQLAELRRSIQMIRCASCGAPIDLLHTTTCPYCSAPVSIIDVEKLAQLAAKSGHTTPPPTRVIIPKSATTLKTSTLPPTLIEIGLDVLFTWLGDVFW